MQKKEIKQSIQELYNLYQGNPPIEIIADTLQLSPDEAQMIYNSLVQTGEISIKPKKEKVKRPYVKKHKEVAWNIFLIRVLMGFIGIGASVLSCYYTSIWLFEFLPFFLAILLSFIMILFSILAFQVIIFIWQQKEHPEEGIRWYKWIVWEIKENALVVTFALLWVIVAVFSMGSTVAGQYNQYVVRLKERIEIRETKDTTKEQILLEELRSQEKMLLVTLNDKRRYKEHIVSSLEQFKTIQDQIEKKRDYDSLRYRLTIADKELDTVMLQLSKVRSSIQDKIGSVNLYGDKIEIKDFYEWISDVLSVPKDIVQFWLSVFPALFIDIIAPTGVAVALFLRKRLT